MSKDVPIGPAWKKKEIRNVSAASVVELKAEIVRKKQEFEKEKRAAGTTAVPAVLSGKKFKKPPPPRNRGVSDRAAKDEENKQIETPGASLEASWIALQRKSELYERKLKEGLEGHEDSDDVENGDLVDFLKKTHDKPNEFVADSKGTIEDSSDPWVEITDEFGRTRLVRSSQAKITQVTGLQGFVKAGSQVATEEEEGGSMVFGQGGSEMEAKRLAWEANARAEMMTSSGQIIKEPLKPPTHFDSTREIRTLGTGFYQFSSEENERQKQQEELKSARDATLKERRKAERVKEERKERIDERRRMVLEKMERVKRKRVEGQAENFLKNILSATSSAEKADDDEAHSSVNDNSDTPTSTPRESFYSG